MVQKYSYNENFFREETEAAFYWAGFIAADGCVYVRQTIYSDISGLALVSADHQHLEKFATDLEFNGPVSKREVGVSIIDGHILYSSRIDIYSDRIYDDLANIFDVYPNKTHHHQFPKNILNHKYLRHFMRGYFDGDGGYYLNKSKTNQRPQMNVRICGTLEFLGIYREALVEHAKVSPINKPYMYNGQGALNYMGNIQVANLSKYLYDSSMVYLDRKYQQALQAIALQCRNKYTKDEIINFFDQYKDIKRIAEVLKCTSSNVKYWANKYDLQHLYRKNYD